VAVEKQYQQLCESWKLELEEKQKQFDQARSQILQPRSVQKAAAAWPPWPQLAPKAHSRGMG
jgi:hypothetical protein